MIATFLTSDWGPMSVVMAVISVAGAIVFAVW